MRYLSLLEVLELHKAIIASSGVNVKRKCGIICERRQRVARTEKNPIYANLVSKKVLGDAQNLNTG